ncbi:MAG: holin family protein [Pseudomonadota bacterium]
MGLIGMILNTVFGNSSNSVRETVEVFRENAEGNAVRGQEVKLEALKQYSAEMVLDGEGAFDRFMNGVNRLPRPALALGTLALFLAAMVDPIWFAARMQGIALVPEPLWWLLGVIVSFYFGARHQVKSQQFQRSIAKTISRAPQIAENISKLRALRPTTPGLADSGPDARLGVLAIMPDRNDALDALRKRLGRPATK